MDLLVIFSLFFLFVAIALWLFRDDVAEWWDSRKGPPNQKGPPKP